MEEYATDIHKMKLPSGNTKDMDQTISKEMFQMTFNPIGWQDRVAVTYHMVFHMSNNNWRPKRVGRLSNG